MAWILVALGLFAAAIAVMAILGARLPRNHVATRAVTLPQSPEKVWPVIMGVMSTSSVPVDILETDPPRRLVSRVTSAETQFGGTWTVVIAPAQAGSILTITEDGWVANPIFRFLARFVIGHHASMDRMLKQVARTLST